MSSGGRTRLKLIVGIAFLFLVSIAAAVVLLLPTQIDNAPQPPGPKESAPVSEAPLIENSTKPAASQNAISALPNPSVVKDQLVAKSQSEKMLSESLRRLARLESEGIRIWGISKLRTSLPEIENTLKKANRYYDQQKYALSVSFFKEANSLFDQLEESREQRFQLAIAEGASALSKLDAATSKKQFEIAVAIKPGDENADLGLKRARALPSVLTNMKQGRYLEKSGDLDRAAKKYAMAASLDPAHQPARQHLQKVREAISDRNYRNAITQALSSLERKNLRAANQALKRAKGIRSNTREVIEIEQRLRIVTINVRLGEIRKKARHLEEQERWAEALSLYKKALSIDGNAAYAQRGEKRTADAIKLHKNFDLYLKNPSRLQSPGPMSHAKALVETAPSSNTGGPILQTKREKLRQLIASAQAPVSVMLQSDGKTNVVLYRVGKMGSFLTRTLKLKPGRYTAVGSRLGYRDIRLVFRVPAGSKNLSVRVECTEPVNR